MNAPPPNFAPLDVHILCVGKNNNAYVVFNIDMEISTNYPSLQRLQSNLTKMTAKGKCQKLIVVEQTSRDDQLSLSWCNGSVSCVISISDASHTTNVFASCAIV